jgi:hypothetical protein
MRSYRYIATSPRFDYPYWMYPTKECGSGPGFDNFFQLPIHVRSRLGEDSFISSREKILLVRMEHTLSSVHTTEWWNLIRTFLTSVWVGRVC